MGKGNYKMIFPKIKTKVVNLPWGLWFAGFTMYPFVFLTTRAKEGSSQYGSTLDHEMIHIEQQERWWRWGGPIGWILWFLLYTLVLPVGWNPFRWKWEYEAFEKGSRYDDKYIRTRLHGFYQLWLM